MTDQLKTIIKEDSTGTQKLKTRVVYWL